MILYQDPKLKKLRKNLRNSRTETEHKLWQVLRKNQLLGFKFTRQYSVGKYVLDFYCPSLRLSIELDGSQHLEPENLKYDAIRTEFINRQGITELRFFDNDVFNNMEGVVEKIIQTVENITP